MKLLNEGNLAYFSTCSSQSTKEGWLYKKGEVNKNFQKRWFVLKGNLLFYFDRPGDKDPNGVIILEGYTVELFDGPTDGFTFQIAFKGASGMAAARRYVLQAESHKVMVEWMKTITCASYDYMKLMVAELKSQLDELTTQELSNELAECKSRSASFDLFGQERFDAVSISQGTVKGIVSDSVEQAGRIDNAHVIGDHVANTRRINPFDRNYISKESGEKNYTDEDKGVDSFGQMPFNRTCKDNSATANLRVPSPVPLTQSTTKISPKLLRKLGSSPKVFRKANGQSVSSKAMFYEDAAPNDKDLPSGAALTSTFKDLHTIYGTQIKSFLAKATQAGPVHDSGGGQIVDTLIELS